MYIVQVQYDTYINQASVSGTASSTAMERWNTKKKRLIEMINVWNYLLFFEGGGGPKQVVVPCHLWKGNPQGKFAALIWLNLFK